MPHLLKRKVWARIWILVVFLILMAGQWYFYRFSMDSMNTYAVSKGMTFGCALWSTVLLGAMWLRYGWARYFLIVLLCLAIIGFGAVALLLKSEMLSPIPGPTRSVIFGLLLYTLALVPLGASHDLRNYLGPRTAGGR
jgi:hypothetical protein